MGDFDENLKNMFAIYINGINPEYFALTVEIVDDFTLQWDADLYKLANPGRFIGHKLDITLMEANKCLSEEATKKYSLVRMQNKFLT
jgi:hypothetical protein